MATDIDHRIVLRHMPDCPLYMERKAGERFDTGDAETTLDIMTPFMSDRDRPAKQRALSQRAGEGWVWNMQAEQEPPRLPAVTLPKADPTPARTV